MHSLVDVERLDLPVDVPPYGPRPEYASDVAVDVLRALEIPFIALNPGSSYRGLHDSLVNYGGNRTPQIILCCHEEIAVDMAHGYYKATGRPMAAAVHDLAGLMHSTMGIWGAWCTRSPVLVLGGTAPMDPARRRPIDWSHTALVPGELVRNFTKWDDQPASAEAIPESLLRAYQIMMTEPRGPVYLCFDQALQEQRLSRPIPVPDVRRYAPPAPPAPEPRALRLAAERLIQAELPLILADRVGRGQQAVDNLVALAETIAAPVVANRAWRMSFPTTHDLDFGDQLATLLPRADVVLGLDAMQLAASTRTRLYEPEARAEGLRPDAAIINVSLEQLAARGWAADYRPLPAADISMLADTGVAIPALLEECRRLLAEQDGARQRIGARLERLRAERREWLAATEAQARRRWDERPIAPQRVVGEVVEAVKGLDWVLSTPSLASRESGGGFELLGAHQYLGGHANSGVGHGPGVALGAALALKGSEKLSLAMMGDGDLLFTSSALWTAAHYRLPGLWVIFNNRSYYNDEEHQEVVARERGRPVQNKHIGMRLEDPPVDLAALARSYGHHGEGPVEDPDALGPALQRALGAARQGRLALVDVVIQPR